jgi:AcrR family transcriptional regulator
MGKREDKARATRAAILSAAARMVGKVGYGRASVSRIADEAGVSAGLIYRYFATQQDLFDHILPELGEAMLRHIAAAASGIEDPIERERVSFEANLSFLDENPHMLRVMAEAAHMVPDAHRAYLERIARAYRRSLVHARAKGYLAEFDDSELEALALMFIGAREYLLERYSLNGPELISLPQEMRDTYMKTVRRIMGQPQL